MVRYRWLLGIIAILIVACRSNTKDTEKRSRMLLDEIADGTAYKEFPEKYFPKDQTIQLITQLKDYCDFKDRQGNFINDFYQKSPEGVDQVSYIYEFHLKCDDIRFIITYRLGDTVELTGVRLESTKKDNPMILKPERRLKVE